MQQKLLHKMPMSILARLQFCWRFDCFVTSKQSGSVTQHDIFSQFWTVDISFEIKYTVPFIGKLKHITQGYLIQVKLPTSWYKGGGNCFCPTLYSEDIFESAIVDLLDREEIKSCKVLVDTKFWLFSNLYCLYIGFFRRKWIEFFTFFQIYRVNNTHSDSSLL